MSVADDNALLRGDITFRNHALFTNASEYDCVWEVMCDGEIVTSGTLALDIPTWQPSELVAPSYVRRIPYALPDTLKAGAEYFLNVSFRLKEAKIWADAGYETSREQFKLPVKPMPGGVGLSTVPALGSIADNENNAVITGNASGKAFSVTLSKSTGLITDYSIGGKQLIKNGPVPNYYRALVDNDLRGGAYNTTIFGAYINQAWREAGVGKTVEGFKLTQLNSKSVQVTVSGNLNSKDQSGANLRPSPYSIEYTIFGNGDVVVNNKVSPNPSSYHLGMVGSYLQLPLEYKNVEYFGRGPLENYIDRYYGNKVGLYKTTVEGMFVNRQRPMEMGNRIDTRWVSVTDDQGFGLLAVAEDKMEFSALHWTADDLSTYTATGQGKNPPVKHPYELKTPTEVNLNLNHIQMGVGSENWERGPYGQAGTLNYGDFMVRNNRDYEYTYTLRPIFPGESGVELSKTLVTGAPMIEKILVGGVEIADFAEKVKGYDFVLSTDEPFPIVSVSAYEGVSVEISQASIAQKYAVIKVSRQGIEGIDEDSFTVNFVRDPNFLTNILLNGSRILDYNPTIRDYTVSWPGDQALPTVSVANAAGITSVITQADAQSKKATIIASNAYEDEQTYTITFLLSLNYDTHRPAQYGRPINIQTLPLGGPVRFRSYSNHNYYYINNPPTAAASRGDIPFVGLYPNRFLAFGDMTGDNIVIDETTGKKVYVHKNTAGTGNANAVGDTQVGIEAQNTTNIAGQTIVMYAKVRPVSGSFSLSFRDGNTECRNAAEIFKVVLVNTGIRYSTTTTNNGSANGAVAATAMTAWQTTLDRNLYYEIWMMDTPNAPDSTGHNVQAFVRFTDANGQEVFYSSPLRRQTTASATTMNWTTFALQDGNTTSSVNIEAFNVYILNRESPLITYDVSGPDEIVVPVGDAANSIQLSATVVHTAEDRIPVPYVTANAKWEVVGAPSGVSIDQTGRLSVTKDFAGGYIDVSVSNADEASKWAPATYRVSIAETGISIRKSGDSVAADFRLVNLKDSQAMCILAIYNESGILVNVVNETVIAAADDQKYTLSSAIAAGYSAKAFLWDKNYVPICEAA